MANIALPEGVTKSDLECVMLDVDLFDLEQAMGPLFREEELFYGDSEDLKYAQGAVAESTAHITLLFGIHPSPEYELSVLTVLDGWEIPDKIYIDEVTAFPTADDVEYQPVVAKIVPRAELLTAHARLQVLPHTNEFLDYKPHVTLAYVKKPFVSKWVKALNGAFAYKIIQATNLNLGHDD